MGNHPFINQVALVDQALLKVKAVRDRYQHSSSDKGDEDDKVFDNFRSTTIDLAALPTITLESGAYSQVPSQFATISSLISVYSTSNKSDVTGTSYLGTLSDEQLAARTVQGSRERQSHRNLIQERDKTEQGARNQRQLPYTHGDASTRRGTNQQLDTRGQLVHLDTPARQRRDQQRVSTKPVIRQTAHTARRARHHWDTPTPRGRHQRYNSEEPLIHLTPVRGKTNQQRNIEEPLTHGEPSIRGSRRLQRDAEEPCQVSDLQDKTREANRCHHADRDNSHGRGSNPMLTRDSDSIYCTQAENANSYSQDSAAREHQSAPMHTDRLLGPMSPPAHMPTGHMPPAYQPLGPLSPGHIPRGYMPLGYMPPFFMHIYPPYGPVPPEHMPPGHMPPGHMPPGHMPPGHMPPGHMPPGHMPPGRMPPGHMPPGRMPPGYVVPGHIRPRHMPPGHMPPGYMPPGYMPPGYMPPGYMPPGYMPPGYMPPGYMPPGYMPPGYMPPGYMPPGRMPPGHMPPGYMPPGYMVPGHMVPGHMVPGHIRPRHMPRGYVPPVPVHRSHIFRYPPPIMRLPVPEDTSATTQGHLAEKSPRHSDHSNLDERGAQNFMTSQSGNQSFPNRLASGQIRPSMPRHGSGSRPPPYNGSPPPDNPAHDSTQADYRHARWLEETQLSREFRETRLRGDVLDEEPGSRIDQTTGHPRGMFRTPRVSHATAKPRPDGTANHSADKIWT
jgi:hypothetical protein